MSIIGALHCGERSPRQPGAEAHRPDPGIEDEDQDRGEREPVEPRLPRGGGVFRVSGPHRRDHRATIAERHRSGNIAGSIIVRGTHTMDPAVIRALLR